MKRKNVELLAPAGDIEKLKVAIAYGADAVYIGGEIYGLRSAAGNFAFNEIERGIDFAHRLGRKVYLVVNTFPEQGEIDGLSHYLRQLSQLELDAIIVADPGVFALAKEITPFKIHLSTQSSVTNVEAVKFWAGQGISRIVLARELPIEEMAAIKQNCDIELEVFIHGSMCMSYSGNCTISNYTANRDANRGGCVNSCRWEYDLSYSSEELAFDRSYVMNSRDLCTADHIHGILNAGIDSLKIEGRMKSHLYLSNTVKTYRTIVDAYLEQRHVSNIEKERWLKQLNANPNRGFTSAFLNQRAGRESILYGKDKSFEMDSDRPNSNYIGLVKSVTNNHIVLQVKNPFYINDILLFHGFHGEEIEFKVHDMKDICFESIDKAKPNSLVYLEQQPDIQPYYVASLKLNLN